MRAWERVFVDASPDDWLREPIHCARLLRLSAPPAMAVLAPRPLRPMEGPAVHYSFAAG